MVPNNISSRKKGPLAKEKEQSGSNINSRKKGPLPLAKEKEQSESRRKENLDLVVKNPNSNNVLGLKHSNLNNGFGGYNIELNPPLLQGGEFSSSIFSFTDQGAQQIAYQKSYINMPSGYFNRGEMPRRENMPPGRFSGGGGEMPRGGFANMSPECFNGGEELINPTFSGYPLFPPQSIERPITSSNNSDDYIVEDPTFISENNKVDLLRSSKPSCALCKDYHERYLNVLDSFTQFSFNREGEKSASDSQIAFLNKKILKKKEEVIELKKLNFYLMDKEKVLSNKLESSYPLYFTVTVSIIIFVLGIFSGLIGMLLFLSKKQ